MGARGAAGSGRRGAAGGQELCEGRSAGRWVGAPRWWSSQRAAGLRVSQLCRHSGFDKFSEMVKMCVDWRTR